MVSRLLIKEINNILKSSCSVNHINVVDQDTNWIQISNSLKPNLFYLDKLHLVEKGNFILAKSIFTSVKNCFSFQNNHQPNKTYKLVTSFSLNNSDFPTLTPLSPRKPVSYCISVSSYKSEHNFFSKPVHKPFFASSVKPVPVVVHKYFI